MTFYSQKDNLLLLLYYFWFLSYTDGARALMWGHPMSSVMVSATVVVIYLLLHLPSGRMENMSIISWSIWSFKYI